MFSEFSSFSELYGFAYDYFSTSALWILFITGFLSATLLPGGSEAALLATLAIEEYPLQHIIIFATLGNTLGGLTCYWLGFLVPQRILSEENGRHQGLHNGDPNSIDDPHDASDICRFSETINIDGPNTVERKNSRVNCKKSASIHALSWLSRYGYLVLLLSWLPIIGDPLCLAAGWLRMRFLPCLLFIMLGKLLRYSFLSALFFGFF